MMEDETFIDHIVNTFGNDHFDVDAIIGALHEKIAEMQEQKQNIGSMLALINILPEIAEEAKQRY